MTIRSFALLTLVAAAAAMPAAAAQLIGNGGFENTGFGGTGGYYNIGLDNPVPADFVWALTTNNVDIVKHGAYAPVLATGGSYAIDLVGYGATGGLTQTINTLAGKTYNVSIAYANNAGAALGTADVSFNGSSIGTINGSRTWQLFTTSFVGTGAPASFTIDTTAGGGNGGAFIDNVSVTGSVPEPQSWMLLIVGFGLVGAAARRRPAVSHPAR